MCAIIGSPARIALEWLVDLNSYRGSHSYSLSVYNPVKRQLYQIDKGFGSLPKEKIRDYDGYYWIGHVQAPTTESKDINSVHPAEYKGHKLWHNGILKESTIRKLQDKFKTDEKWDTKLLLMAIVDNYNNLNDIDGTFSCLHYSANGSLYLFRNELSPLFYDPKTLSISSTKFSLVSEIKPELSREVLETKPGTVYFMNLMDMELIPHDITFKTVENPYYFGE